MADERAGRRARGARLLRLQPARAVQAGKIQDAEAAAACRMLDQAGYGRYRVAATGGLPNLHGYPRAVTCMMPATRARPPAVFVQQLHRAAAQRGRLDPVYQDLSDHWTRILQRLYPVWALIGPGLSDPGHIELHSRTSTSTPTRCSARATRSPPACSSGGRSCACSGSRCTRRFHAKHTKRWAIEHDIALSESEDPGDRQLAVDRRLLEEPRMEAHGVRDFPPDSLRGRFIRRALQAAVVDVILPAFAEQILASLRSGCRAEPRPRRPQHRYLQARTHYGDPRPSSPRPLRAVWERVLGER